MVTDGNEGPPFRAFAIRKKYKGRGVKVKRKSFEKRFIFCNSSIILLAIQILLNSREYQDV